MLGYCASKASFNRLLMSMSLSPPQKAMRTVTTSCAAMGRARAATRAITSTMPRVGRFTTRPPLWEPCVFFGCFNSTRRNQTPSCLWPSVSPRSHLSFGSHPPHVAPAVELHKRAAASRAGSPMRQASVAAGVKRGQRRVAKHPVKRLGPPVAVDHSHRRDVGDRRIGLVAALVISKHPPDAANDEVGALEHLLPMGPEGQALGRLPAAPVHGPVAKFGDQDGLVGVTAVQVVKVGPQVLMHAVEKAEVLVDADHVHKVEPDVVPVVVGG